MTVRVFQEMIGSTIDSINQTSTELNFRSSDGRKFRFYHDQDCCESVYIEDIAGDLGDLLHSPLTMAEEVSNLETPKIPEFADRSYTWTFYRFGTIKGSVTVRWFGTSNGYYSESVDYQVL